MSTASELLARVRLRPAFRLLSDVVGERARKGRSVEALRMLVSIGASPGVAHQIVEGWPATAAGSRVPGLTVDEEAACRLASFVADLDAHDWPELLTRAITAAERPLRPSSTRPAGAR